MSERDELVARLRAVENDWATTACYNGTRIEAASLLERDGAEIERLERELAEAREERYPPIPPNGSAARSLGAFLADVLCEDQWARAEEMLLGIHAAYVALGAENEALRKDAERYRWLRDDGGADVITALLRYDGEEYDALIDAAKERTP